MRALIFASLVSLGFLLASCGSSVVSYHPIEEFEVADTENVWVVTGKRDLLHVDESGAIRKLIVGEAVAVDFVNDRIGWVVNESGDVLKTSDGGVTWRKVGLLPDRQLGLRGTEIDFVDEQVGWVKGNWWSVWRTEDGGANWKEFELYEETYEQNLTLPRSILAVSRDEFWSGSATGMIFRTFDGGQTWKTSALPERVDVADLDIDRYGRIWVGTVGTWARGYLFVSDNKGDDWEEPEFSKALGRIGISSIDFSDDGHGWILGSKLLSEDPFTRSGDFLMKTENFGTTWEEFPVDNFPFIPRSLEFVNNSVGFLVGYDKIAITKDAGASWKIIYGSS